MFITVHTLAGAAVASAFPNPIMSIPLAFGGHFVLDAIPHWQDISKGERPTKTTYSIVVVDAVVAIAAIAYVIFYAHNFNLLYGIIAGSIMDSDVVLYPFFEKRGWRKIWPKSISKFHGKIQNETKSMWGVITQLVVILISLYIVTYA